MRQLEREIGRVMRRAAMRVAEVHSAAVRVDAADLDAIFGAPRFEHEIAMRTVPGVATGLAWTPVGGDILFIEATRVNGRGHLILTGQLGGVMKESAQAALTLVKGAQRRSASIPQFLTILTYMFTCPRAQSRRMGRAREWQCS